MIKIKKDLTNKKFGMLTVLGLDREKTEKVGRTCWICSCECGNVKTIRGDDINKKQDCGCVAKKEKAKRFTKHGMNGTRIHRIWLGVIQRCYIESASGYKNYGGRGIKVCDEWLNKEDGFMNFYNWAINNNYTDELTIDRKYVDGNYEPENCRWSTIKEQENNKRNTRYVTIDGEKHSLSEWSEITGLNMMVLNERYEKGKITKEEFFKANDRCRIHVEYKGEMVNLKELSKLTGISYDALNERYNKGLRGEKLIEKGKSKVIMG